MHLINDGDNVAITGIVANNAIMIYMTLTMMSHLVLLRAVVFVRRFSSRCWINLNQTYPNNGAYIAFEFLIVLALG